MRLDIISLSVRTTLIEHIMYTGNGEITSTKSVNYRRDRDDKLVSIMKANNAG